MRASVIRRACWAVAAVAVAAGGLLLVVPARVDVAPTAPLVPDSSRTRPAIAGNPAVAEEIAIANVFAASRTPPSSRYMPPELAGESANGVMAEPPPDSAMTATPEVEGDVPRLYGTLVGPDGPKALLHLDPTASGPRLYSQGDSGGGYRVVSIAPRIVVLRGPRGRTTLRLEPEEDRR
ncbi:MAG: hypothetical protein ACT4P7_14615 [Gemmatimonadaceae bacterium]